MLDDLLDDDRMDRGNAGAAPGPTHIGSLVRRTVEESDMQGRPVLIAAVRPSASSCPIRTALSMVTAAHPHKVPA